MFLITFLLGTQFPLRCVFMHSIRVESGNCLKSGRTIYALYSGALPIVAATIFLRHLDSNRELSSNTLAAYAYALKSFFEFLRNNNISFWKISQATIKSYKRFHLNRYSKNGKFVLKRVTARQYLFALKQLIGYWRGLREDDPLFIDHVANLDGKRLRENRRGMLSHISWYSRVPNDLWQIKIPQEEQHYKKRYKGLTLDECRTVRDVLDKDTYHTDIQAMIYFRDRALWAFMLMTMLRKGELVRIRVEDLDQRSGLIYLVDRPEDQWLGDLKTGPDEIYVTSINPLWNVVNSWLTEGRWIAEKMLRSEGRDDHGMLFCNRDGGPLTQYAVDNLFRRLREACSFPKSKLFFPHISRHTMASLMLDSGVNLTEVQRQLRRACLASTEIYARVSVQQLRASLKKFWQEGSI